MPKKKTKTKKPKQITGSKTPGRNRYSTRMLKADIGNGKLSANDTRAMLGYDPIDNAPRDFE